MPHATGRLALVPPGEITAPARPRPRPVASTGRAGTVVWASKVLVYLAALLGGLAIALAWLLPETLAAALLGWVAAVLLVFVVRARPVCFPAYCGGLVGHLVGFHWVYSTVAVAGGLGAAAGALIFALFVASGALQFLIFALIHHNLGPSYDALALRAPTAVVLSELVTIRLFCWHFGHTQIAFTPFAQVAGIGGALAVSFLMFWLAEVVVRVVVFRERRRAFWFPLLAFGLALGYGVAMMRTFAARPGIPQEVVLVQGNASLATKRDLGSARRNLARLYDLTRQAARPNALIVWPEGSIPAYLPADLGAARGQPVLPCLGDGSAFLIGSYACGSRQERYNAAFAVHPDGHVPAPYFKQVLIPFGEYVPFASVFPWLKEMNRKAGVFTAGKGARVFRYPMRRSDGTAYLMKVSPLICYEDTLPTLAREATQAGAELLVNLTSDSWFGRSVAPHQHHLIAAFRAIENRRFLVRATNTGLSAVVDPLGRTVDRIRPFAEGVATARVSLLNYQSSYAGFVHDRPWWALLTVSVITVAVRRRKGVPVTADRPATAH